MKISGAEIAEWHNTAWPAGYIWADESTLLDGRDIYVEDKPDTFVFAPDEIITIPDYWGMVLEDKESPKHPKDTGHGLDIRALIRAWRKAKATALLIVRVPNTELDAARALIKEQGWHIDAS